MNDHKLEAQIQRVKLEKPDEFIGILSSAIVNEVPLDKLGQLLRIIEKETMDKCAYEQMFMEENHSLQR